MRIARFLRALRVLLYIWHIQVKYRHYRYAVEHPLRSLYFSTAGTVISAFTLLLTVALWTGYLHH